MGMKFSILSVAVLLTACSIQGSTDPVLVPVSEKLCAVFSAKPAQMGTRLWFPTFKSEAYTVCTREDMKEKIEITMEFK